VTLLSSRGDTLTNRFHVWREEAAESFIQVKGVEPHRLLSFTGEEPQIKHG